MDLLKKTSLTTKNNGFQEDLVKIIIKEILLAIRKLHSQGKIIKSLKTSSIFVSLNGDVKLLQFSFGKAFKEAMDKNKTFLAGTPVYLAPEVIENLEYSEKSDVWALGIIAIELFQGTNPFAEPQSPVTLFEIVHKNPPKLTKPSSNEFREFVDLCLKKDKDKRGSVDSLLNSKFMVSTREKHFLSNFVYTLQEKNRSYNLNPSFQKEFDFVKLKGSGVNSKINFSKMFFNVERKEENEEREKEEDGMFEARDPLQMRIQRKINLLASLRPGLIDALFREILNEYEKVE